MTVTVQKPIVICKINDLKGNQHSRMSDKKYKKAAKARKVLLFGDEEAWDAFMMPQTSIMGRYFGCWKSWGVENVRRTK